MKKKCRVYKKGLPKGKDGFTTQDGGPQEVHAEKQQNFLSKLQQNSQIFEQDEPIADKISIMQSLIQEVPQMKQGGQNWMKEARKSMERKGTVGKFTEYCGGKVTADCIERGLNSPDEKVRKRAAFAKAARTVAKGRSQWGGMVQDQEELMQAQDGVNVNFNPDAFRNVAAYYADKGANQLNRSVGNFLTGATAMASDMYRRPKHRYRLKDDYQFFDQNGQLTDIEFTNYIPGKGKKYSYLDYKAKGKKDMPLYIDPTKGASEEGYALTQGEGTMDQPSWDPSKTNIRKQARQEQKEFDKATGQNSGFFQNMFDPSIRRQARQEQRQFDREVDGRDPFLDRMFKGPMDRQTRREQREFDKASGYDDGEGFELFPKWNRRREAMKKLRNSSYSRGGLVYAENGVSFPDAPDYDYQFDDGYIPNPSVESSYPTLYNNENTEVSQPYFGRENIEKAERIRPSSDPKENPYAALHTGFNDDMTIKTPDLRDEMDVVDPLAMEETGRLRLKKQGRLSQFMEDNPYAVPEMALTTLGVFEGIGNMFKANRGDQQYADQVSDVHRRYGSKAAGRGDYMANVSGVGNWFRPDDYTRKGYGTKMAQMGYEVGDELELTDEEIQELIAQGYELEF